MIRTLQEEVARLETHARKIFDAAVAAADPGKLMMAAIASGAIPPLEDFGRVVLLACGKAAVPMSRALMEWAGSSIDAGLVTAPAEDGRLEAIPGLEVMISAHPVPDRRSESAARRALQLAGESGRGDLVLVLLSGGASALWALPAHGLTLDDLQATVRTLLHAGADIGELNTVRKHLSAIKGGRLAEAAWPARLLALVVSDVVGDDPSTIGSGPTVADPTTYEDALAVIDARGGRDAYPADVIRFLLDGSRGVTDETPGPGSPRLNRSEINIIGSNRDALRGASGCATDLGYHVELNPHPVTGEASRAGGRVAGLLAATPAHPLRCLLSGGETTVTVRGSGRGGRNQEFALAAAIELDGLDRPIVLLSGGTDGIDGPTDAAGAIASALTCGRARNLDLDPAAFLAANDSHSFFDRVGGLVRTGPTGTNVVDVQIGLVGPHP